METPSQAIVAAGNATGKVTDAQGREIVVRRLNALDRMRLAELVGADNVHNEVYFGYASLAYHVASIGGVPEVKPATKRQLEALVQKLDDDGLKVVGPAIAALYGDAPAVEATDQLKN